MVSIFDDEDVRDSFQRTDFKVMRTAAFSNKTLWDSLTERTIPRFDRERAERYVCELLGDNGGGMGLHELEKVHCASNAQQERQPRHQIPIASISFTNQCVNCGSTFADRSTAQNHVVNSWSRGTCRTNSSHMTWALEEVTHPISCNLCAQEFGD